MTGACCASVSPLLKCEGKGESVYVGNALHMPGQRKCQLSPCIYIQVASFLHTDLFRTPGCFLGVHIHNGRKPQPTEVHVSLCSDSLPCPGLERVGWSWDTPLRFPLLLSVSVSFIPAPCEWALPRLSLVLSVYRQHLCLPPVPIAAFS